MSDQNKRSRIVDLAGKLVSAYLGNNHVRADEVPDLIGLVHRTLHQLAAGKGSGAAPSAPQVKASPQDIRRSITPEYLVSFEDGRQYKTLGRHLRARGLTPEAYRRKWGLPVDYPMTARAHSEQRSQAAQSRALGGPRRYAQGAKPIAANGRLMERSRQAGFDEPIDRADQVDVADADPTEVAVELIREPFEDDGMPDEV